MRKIVIAVTAAAVLSSAAVETASAAVPYANPYVARVAAPKAPAAVMTIPPFNIPSYRLYW